MLRILLTLYFVGHSLMTFSVHDPRWGGAATLPVDEQWALDLSLDGSTPPDQLRPQSDVKTLEEKP